MFLKRRVALEDTKVPFRGPIPERDPVPAVNLRYLLVGDSRSLMNIFGAENCGKCHLQA